MATRNIALGAAGLAALLGAGTYSAVHAHNAEGAMSEVAITAALNALPVPQAGRYIVESRLLELAMPGMTQKELEDAREQVASFFPEGQSVCLNEVEAAALLSAAIPVIDPEMCSITRFDVKGEAFDALGVCDGSDGGNDYVRAAGTMTRAGFSVVTDMYEGPNSGTSIMKVQLDAQRVEDCVPE